MVPSEPRRWRVRRRWSPWRRRIRDVPDMPLLDAGSFDGTIGAILLVIGLILSIPALIVLSLLVFELLLLLLVLPLVILLRLLLPVPWTIDVSSRPQSRRFGGWQLEREVRVAGWRESSAAIHELRRHPAAELTADNPFGA